MIRLDFEKGFLLKCGPGLRSYFWMNYDMVLTVPTRLTIYSMGPVIEPRCHPRKLEACDRLLWSKAYNR